MFSVVSASDWAQFQCNAARTGWTPDSPEPPYRLEWVATRTPEATERALHEVVPEEWWSRVNDLLVHHGKTICKPQGPQCESCPVPPDCPYPGK